MKMNTIFSSSSPINVKNVIETESWVEQRCLRRRELGHAEVGCAFAAEMGRRGVGRRQLGHRMLGRRELGRAEVGCAFAAESWVVGPRDGSSRFLSEKEKEKDRERKRDTEEDD